MRKCAKNSENVLEAVNSFFCALCKSLFNFFSFFREGEEYESILGQQAAVKKDRFELKKKNFSIFSTVSTPPVRIRAIS